MGIFGAFILALLIAFLFSPYKNRDSAAPLLILFLVLFFGGLAAQFWIVPFGPIVWGVSWFPIFFIILIFGLLFSAPPRHRRAFSTKDTQVNEAATISIFIWVLLLILAIAAIVGLYYSDVFK